MLLERARRRSGNEVAESSSQLRDFSLRLIVIYQWKAMLGEIDTYWAASTSNAR